MESVILHLHSKFVPEWAPHGVKIATLLAPWIPSAMSRVSGKLAYKYHIYGL